MINIKSHAEDRFPLLNVLKQKTEILKKLKRRCKVRLNGVDPNEETKEIKIAGEIKDA